jgi:hypothetical protein
LGANTKGFKRRAIKNTMVNNTKQIREFLEANLNEECFNSEFYKFDVMIRKKDNPESIFMKHHKGSFLLRSWLISSLEQYDKYIEEMKYLCDIIGARLYMTLDRKSTQSMAINLADYGSDLLKSLIRKNTISTKNIFNVMNSLTSKKELSVHQSKKLLFDIDTQDIDKVSNVIQSLYPEEVGHLYVLNSPNGWHVITDKFNQDLIPKQILEDEEIDVKENALTIVYFNKEGS